MLFNGSAKYTLNQGTPVNLQMCSNNTGNNKGNYAAIPISNINIESFDWLWVHFSFLVL